MDIKEVIMQINKMEISYGEDFYDLGGGSIAMSDAIDNLAALEYLKTNKPLIYKHICKNYYDTLKEDLDSLVSKKDKKINKLEHDYFFVFNNEILDKNLFKELKEFSDGGDYFCCGAYELWKYVLVIIANAFPNVEECLEEILEKNNFGEY